MAYRLILLSFKLFSTTKKMFLYFAQHKNKTCYTVDNSHFEIKHGYCFLIEIEV